MTNRREFIATISFMGTALAANQAMAQAAMLAETDAQAVALGYKADTKKVDAKKFPKHAATQQCTNCALFQGKAADKSGGCSLFPGKQVAGGGWCSAYAKKA
ncbi:MAG TPA: high-potential iron-sulfur protein [Burkholderiaceae bacterium]|nr:high-potential iron-sulfur protein [Burkholderiaceae bacterium]